MNKVDQAIKEHKMIKVVNPAGEVRILEPYAKTTGKDSILLHCYQVAGVSSSGRPEGWKNIKLTDISYTTILGEFEHRPEFNPSKLRGIIE